MQEQVELAEFAAGFFKDAVDLFVARDIAREQQGVGAERAGQLLHILLEALPLIGESQCRAGSGPGLCDRPGDGPLVGNSENDSGFPGQLRHTLSRISELEEKS